ncbi:MAG: PilZ domain-containing protein [Myxococcaceae bacterium]|nr:PilZ domain-containing protein [Myxococcaceae bacterium]
MSLPPGAPIRLKVGYKTPETLLGELTKSVGRGGVRIEAKKTVPVGTKFVFELKSVGVKESVEVSGTVQTVTETAPGRYVLHIRYEPPRNRQGLDAVLKRIFEATEKDVRRRTPRVPLHVRATENSPNSPIYRLRDLSRGGMGLDVECEILPTYLQVGTPTLVQMRLTTGQLAAHGEIIWVVQPDASKAMPARVGVHFGKLSPAAATMLDDLLTLKALPQPPWIARLAFGNDALSQMK